MDPSSHVVSPTGPTFRVGEWTVWVASGRLERGAAVQHARPMLMDLLALLAESAGEVVSKDRIIDRVWQGRAVGDSALSRNVSELRSLLGDEVSEPRYIETIPKRGYRLIAEVTWASESTLRRVAVLPFANLNREAAEDFFADGMTDALITELGRVRGLRVVSRQSVLHLRNSDKTAPEIGRELGVGYLIEGAALRAGESVRITAQLVRTSPEAHVWADRYERKLRDVLALREQVARAVAEAVEVELALPEQRAEPGRRAVDPRSYLAYLKARQLGGAWTEEAIRGAFRYLHEAIEADPEFAPAHQMLAMCWIILGYWGHLSIRDAYPQAKAAALRAIDLDPEGSDSHLAIGMVSWLHDWDLDACAAAFRRALDLNPSSESAHLYLALFLVAVRDDPAGCVEHGRRALALDPLSLNTNFAVAWLLLFAGEYEQAIDQANATLEMYPESLHPLYVAGWAHVGRSRAEEAIASFERAVALSRDPIALAYLGHAYGRASRTSAARQILAELRTASAKSHVPPMSFVILHAGLGELDEAFAWLERSLEERDSRLFWLPVVPAFAPLRQDPRYGEVLRLLRPV